MDYHWLLVVDSFDQKNDLFIPKLFLCQCLVKKRGPAVCSGHDHSLAANNMCVSDNLGTCRKANGISPEISTVDLESG